MAAVLGCDSRSEPESQNRIPYEAPNKEAADTGPRGNEGTPPVQLKKVPVATNLPWRRNHFRGAVKRS